MHLPESTRHLGCQTLSQGLSTLMPAALTDASNISFGFPYWRSHYKYHPVAISALDWDRRSPFTTGSVFSRVSPLKTICLLTRAEQDCGNRCRLSLFLNETFLLLYTAVILFICVRERFVWKLVLLWELRQRMRGEHLRLFTKLNLF